MPRGLLKGVKGIAQIVDCLPSPSDRTAYAEREAERGMSGGTKLLSVGGAGKVFVGPLTREDGLVELVHDAVAVGLLVPQGLHAGREAGGAEVDLLRVRVLLRGLAVLATDEAQLGFESRRLRRVIWAGGGGGVLARKRARWLRFSLTYSTHTACSTIRCGGEGVVVGWSSLARHLCA